jgi:hypothetical protein
MAEVASSSLVFPAILFYELGGMAPKKPTHDSTHIITTPFP